MKKRFMTIALGAAFLIGAMFAVPTAVSAETDTGISAGNSLTAAKGVYYFDTHELGKDLTDTFIYDDALLKGDSKAYNQQLATMSFELAVASISSEREPKTAEGYANKSRNLRAYLTDNGFLDFDTNQYYKEKMTTETMGAACAHKKIVDGDKEYTLLAIVPRSAGYEAEWGGNFVVGETGDHAGFLNGKNIVLSFAKEYIEKYGIEGDIKVWTAGYSRGAGVTNQVGAALIRDPEGALGSAVSLAPGNLYCYTFGTPKSADVNGDYQDEKFAYIHNTYEKYDIVTVAPPAGFGFDRYGTTTGYADRGDKDRMLQMLEQTNETVYNLYMNGGDPDGFTPKKLDIQTMAKDKKLAVIDDPDSYLPKTQVEYMAMMEDSIVVAAGNSRKVYHDVYEEPMRHLCGYYFANTEETGNLIKGITESKCSIPMAISMYVSFVADRYKNNAITEEQRAMIKAALEELEQVIAEMQAEGADIPEEYIEAYNEMVEALAKAEKYEHIAAASQNLTALLYSQVMKDALTAAGADQETIAQITSMEDSRAVSHMLSYLLLYDKLQTEEISFSYLNQQFCHMATFIGNASSFMRPHNNEIILSWLRTLDPYYDDYAKENEAQKTGYRRVYIPQGDVKITVWNAKENKDEETVAATYTVIDGQEVFASNDSWVGLTSCDTGSWIRLPLDQAYRVEIGAKADLDAMNLKLTEYDVYDGTEVREINWQTGAIPKDGNATLNVPAIGQTGQDALPSDAEYKVTTQSDEQADPVPVDPVPEVTETPVIAAKAVAKGKKKAVVKWNAVDGASQYVVYLAKSSVKGKTGEFKAVKTLDVSKTKVVLKGLKKKAVYSVKVEAQQTAGEQNTILAESQNGFFITGNVKGKFTNPKKLKLKTSEVTIAAGETAVVKGKVKKVKAGKKLLTKCAMKLRFVSSDPAVATVDAGGNVTAVGAGSCQVWVQTINGIWKTVPVTVQ